MRGSLIGLELLAAKSTFRTMLGVPCEKVFIYSDQTREPTRSTRRRFDPY